MRALLSEGHVVEMAGDGDAGLALQPDFVAEVVITDIFMPNKDGIETIQEFRQRYPEAGIIVMSASEKLNNSTYLAAARQVGADVALPKPFSIERLLEAVTEVTGKDRKASSGRQ